MLLFAHFCSLHEINRIFRLKGGFDHPPAFRSVTDVFIIVLTACLHCSGRYRGFRGTEVETPPIFEDFSNLFLAKLDKNEFDGLEAPLFVHF